MRLKETPPVLRRGLLIVGLKELIELRKAEETIIQSDLVDGFIRNDQFMRSRIDSQFIQNDINLSRHNFTNKFEAKI